MTTDQAINIIRVYMKTIYGDGSNTDKMQADYCHGMIIMAELIGIITDDNAQSLRQEVRDCLMKKEKQDD